MSTAAASDALPYWRLSSFYLFYFAALGALVPYWGLYLQDQGFDALAIGQLMAILMGTKVVAPYLWGWLGDALGRRMPIIRWASAVSVLTFVGIFWVDGFWGVALVMALFSFFWNASLPQMEVVTFSYLGAQSQRYARIRLWGSIGFVVAAIALGFLVEGQGIGVVPPVLLAIYLGIWLASLPIREPQAGAVAQGEHSIAAVLRRPAIIAFFAAIFLMQVAHGPYYTFYTIYLTGYGYSESLLGGLWALGVTAEVLLFLVMHRVLSRWGARRVLIASLLIAGSRWLLIAYFPQSLSLVILAQLLHAATFGAFHAASIHLVHHYFVGRLRGRGQALFSSLSYGAGGAVGALVSGLTWESWGPAATLVAATAVSLLGAWLAWRHIDPAHDH